MLSLAVRTWLRYLAPLTLLAAVTTLPLLAIAAKLSPVLDLLHARWRFAIGGLIAFVAWIAQIWLVAAAAPAARALAVGAPLSQGRALATGAANLARATVPIIAAAAAIVIGSAALVVPGLALAVMLAFTGASYRLGEPMPAPLAESVELVRGAFWRTAAIVAVVTLVNLAIADGGQLALLGEIPRKNPSAALAAAMKLKPLVVVALAALSPLVACVLAARAETSR